MQGQVSPGPGVTHSQNDMAHYDSPFAVGWEHRRREGEGQRVCEEERQLTPMGKKGQLATKSVVQPSLPRGRIPQ